MCELPLADRISETIHTAIVQVRTLTRGGFRAECIGMLLPAAVVAGARVLHAGSSRHLSAAVGANGRERARHTLCLIRGCAFFHRSV